MRATPYILTLLSPSTLRPLCVYDVCREVDASISESSFVQHALDYKALQAELRQAERDGFLAYATCRGFQPKHPFRPEPPILGSHTQWRSVYEPDPWALEDPITL